MAHEMVTVCDACGRRDASGIRYGSIEVTAYIPPNQESDGTIHSKERLDACSRLCARKLVARATDALLEKLSSDLPARND